MENETNISYDLLGLPLEAASILVVWGHGWGQNKSAFKPLAQTLASRAAHLLIDFPGFGASPVPPPEWGTADYADKIADLIRPYRSIHTLVWVGHSFGGRVGLQLAARHPDAVNGLFLIGSAGLPPRRRLGQRLRLAAKVYSFKILKHLAPLLKLNVDDLRQKFGSPDYRSSGRLRTLFLRVIGEDLSDQARRIKCPVQLIYGAKDKEAPPEIGQRLKALIPQARLTILPDQDHYSVLGSGRHVVVKRLADFMESLR